MQIQDLSLKSFAAQDQILCVNHLMKQETQTVA